MRKPKPDNKRSYILHMIDGSERRITIPSHWKLTFGNVLPYIPGSQHPSNNTISGFEYRVCLRIYDGAKENLRAVFKDVQWFHAEELLIETKDTKEVMSTEQRRLESGMMDVEIKANPLPIWRPLAKLKTEGEPYDPN